jgi:hypothetical protein
LLAVVSILNRPIIIIGLTGVGLTGHGLRACQAGEPEKPQRGISRPRSEMHTFGSHAAFLPYFDD